MQSESALGEDIRVELHLRRLLRSDEPMACRATCTGGGQSVTSVLFPFVATQLRKLTCKVNKESLTQVFMQSGAVLCLQTSISDGAVGSRRNVSARPRQHLSSRRDYSPHAGKVRSAWS